MFPISLLDGVSVYLKQSIITIWTVVMHILSLEFQLEDVGADSPQIYQVILDKLVDTDLSSLYYSTSITLGI